jgi:hypothetical protein
MPTLATPVPIEGSAALRALARAFSHLGDFERFTGGLQVALERSGLFERTLLILDRDLADGAAHFSPGALTLPLSAAGESFGTLQIAPGGEHRQFGAADLHLMAGLADFLGAALGQSLQMRDAERNRELLRFLLDQAPVGIAAYGPDRRAIVANALATRWIGAAALPFSEWEQGAGGFHLRAADRLVYGEARRSPAAGDIWFVVLHDLTAEHVRLIEVLKRETYRALAEGGDASFALLEGGAASGGVMRRLPEIRAALGAEEAAGPCDAQRIGLVLRGARGLALRARLRRLGAGLGGADGLSLGYAELGRDGRTPEALLDAAQRSRDAYAAQLRPALLVQDENPAVTETLAMVLGRDCRVVTSASADRTRELLATGRFEGLLAELEPRHGPGGAELGRIARELQPGIRLFLTTLQAPPPADAGNAVLFEKPFDVATLRQAVQAELARAAS